jgi:hypothetical protein
MPDPFNTPALSGPSHAVASGDDLEAAVELAVEKWTVGDVEHAPVVALRTDRLGDALNLRPVEARRLAALLLEAADIADGQAVDWSVTS